MRIALVVHQFLPEHIGGTEVYTWTLGKALMAKGHQVDLFVPRAGARALSAASFDGLTVWSAPSPAPNENAIGAYRHAFRNRRIERAYTRFLRLVRPDVVHIQHLQHVSARIVALSKPIPTVVTLHDYWYLCPNSQLLLPDRSLCDGPRGGWRCAACGLHRAGVRLPKALQALAAPPFAWRYHVVWRALREADCLIAPQRLCASSLSGAGYRARVSACDPPRPRHDALCLDPASYRGAAWRWPAIWVSRLHRLAKGAACADRGVQRTAARCLADDLW